MSFESYGQGRPWCLGGGLQDMASKGSHLGWAVVSRTDPGALGVRFGIQMSLAFFRDELLREGFAGGWL